MTSIALSAFVAATAVARAALDGAGLLGLVGVAVAGYGLGELLRHRREVSAAEPTEATVVGARTVESSLGFGGRSKPAVTYEYTVDGRTYTGNSIYPAADFAGSGDADLAREYDPGQSVTVYCDPDDPGQSFLSRGGLANKYRVVAVGVVFAAAGFLAATGSLPPL